MSAKASVKSDRTRRRRKRQLHELSGFLVAQSVRLRHTAGQKSEGRERLLISRLRPFRLIYDLRHAARDFAVLLRGGVVRVAARRMIGLVEDFAHLRDVLADQSFDPLLQGHVRGAAALTTTAHA